MCMCLYVLHQLLGTNALERFDRNPCCRHVAKGVLRVVVELGEDEELQLKIGR